MRALVALLLVGCSAAQTAKQDATCSPNADIWYAQALVTTCQGRVLSECPESDQLGETYEQKAEAECSSN